MYTAVMSCCPLTRPQSSRMRKLPSCYRIKEISSLLVCFVFIFTDYVEDFVTRPAAMQASHLGTLFFSNVASE